MSLSGVGPMVAAGIVGYVGDPGRFNRAKQVARYAGLDASVHQSGEEDWQERVRKNGPGLLRKLLVQAALQIVRYRQGALAEFCRRKPKKIEHRRAITALVRRLLIAAWRPMQIDRLAHELEDEKARKDYERTLRDQAGHCQVVRAIRHGDASCSVTSWAPDATVTWVIRRLRCQRNS